MLKSTFNGLELCRYLHLFSKSAKSHEILQKLELIQGHPRSSILVSIESAYATFYQLG